MPQPTAPASITALIAEVESVGGAVEWNGERSFDVIVPRRYTSGVKPLRVATVGWYVRDGRNRIGASVHEVRNVVANLREGKDPLKVRRTAAGNFEGRDHEGKFTSGR